MCGIAPANVDDCGRFGDPACPYFGVGEPEPEGVGEGPPAAPPAPEPGEVAELASALKADAECVEVEHYDLCNMTAEQMRRAATLLQQLSAIATEDLKAEAALAQPEPEGLPPRVGHILRLAEIIREVDGNHDKGAAALAEAILSHPGSRWSPTIEPVPVAERLPGPEDCDAEGRCWWLTLAVADGGRGGYSTFWELTTFKAAVRCASHWLPHYALPLPTPTP